MRTASWSEGSTENAKSCGQTIKELEIMKTNTQNKSKSKGTILINKPQKVRRNSLQTHPLTTGKKQIKDSAALHLKTKSNSNRSKRPNVQKKTNEKLPCKKNVPEDKPDQQIDKENPTTGLASLISEKLQNLMSCLARSH